jgi:hypothetical protein
MIIPRDLLSAVQPVAADITDTSWPEKRQRDAEPFPVEQEVRRHNQERARDHLYTRCVRFLDTSLAHLVEERLHPLLLAILVDTLGWLLLES